MKDLAWAWQWKDIGSELLVSADTAALLRSSRQGYWKCERGGQLFVDISDTRGIWLRASRPHPADSAGRSWLELDQHRCLAEIEEANRSGFRLIGYWHTHPQRIPRISDRDRVSFEKFSKLQKEALPNPIAVIVGRSLSYRGIRAWSVRGNALVEAKLIRLTT
jgi:hypothetical protein